MNLKKIKDDYGNYSGVSQYEDEYAEMVEILEEKMEDEGFLTYNDVSSFLSKRGLIVSEYGDLFGNRGGYTNWAFEDDERFGRYGSAGAGVYVEYNYTKTDGGRTWVPNEVTYIDYR